MVTLGTLIDELTITNLKIWHLEDIKRDSNNSDSIVADATRKTNVLNPLRNNLIEEIDVLVSKYINSLVKPKIALTGSTKVYADR